MLRIWRTFITNNRLWKLVLLTGVGLVALIGGGVAGLNFLFDGDETKQLFLGCALVCLGYGMIGIARKPKMLLRNPALAGSIVMAGILVTYADIWDIPRYVQTSPNGALVLLCATTLAPAIVGVMFIGQKPPRKPDTKFDGLQ